ncbi:MAG: hypothetical protein KKC77_02250, partial [Proteobacteria bacterium]|nr:hypothetical protein [Pseudomonadota bacterium]
LGLAAAAASSMKQENHHKSYYSVPVASFHDKQNVRAEVPFITGNKMSQKNQRARSARLMQQVIDSPERSNRSVALPSS